MLLVAWATLLRALKPGRTGGYVKHVFCADSASKENEEAVYFFVDASSHAVFCTISVNKSGNQINVNQSDNTMIF